MGAVRPLARFKLDLAALIVALSAVGCTHTMEVKNLGEYSLHATAPRSLKLSVERNTSADEAAGDGVGHERRLGQQLVGEDATPALMAAIRDAYGQYIANNVVEMAASAETPQASQSPAPPAAAAAPAPPAPEASSPPASE